MVGHPLASGPHHHSAQHLGPRPSPAQELGPRPSPAHEQGFYQNLSGPGHGPSQPQHRPTARFGSQTSLVTPQGPRDRPISSHFLPANQGQGPPRFPPKQQVPLPQSSGEGPEKPQRQFSYELDSQSPAGAPVRSQSRVRFQDPGSQEEEKMSTIKRNGNIGQSTEQPHSRERHQQETETEEKRREAEIRIEEKRRELEEKERQEARLLADARRRQGQGHLQGSPPPLPSSEPPRETPPPSAPGTTRLDMLLGNSSSGSSRKESSPSKRVSFMPPEARHQEDLQTDQFEEEDLSEEEREESIEDKPTQDPNAFISEAENLLNPALSKLDFSESSSGHTPSVIGTQEVYRDPRSRMLLEKQEKKLSTERPPDGAKLSFKEKMKLFAQEVGENTPRDKAKISKAQREIDTVE